MSLNVVIIAPSYGAFFAAAQKVEAARHVHRSLWAETTYFNNPREMRIQYLSTQQIGEQAADQMRLIDAADVVVTVHDRGTPSTSGPAGYAYAKRIPVIVIGGHTDPFLAAPGIKTIDLNSLSAELNRLEKLKTEWTTAEQAVIAHREASIIAAAARATKKVLDSITLLGETDVRTDSGSADVPNPAGGSAPVDGTGEVDRVDGAVGGDGSHI